MSNKYDDIDFCLNMLYDLVYGKQTECHELKYESKKHVDIDFLKKDTTFDCHEILRGEFTFENINNGKYIFKRHSDTSYSSLVRISKYSDSNINDLNRGELIDMKLNYLFSDDAINDVWKFILFPIMNFDIKFSVLKKINGSIASHIKDVKDSDGMCVQVFEHYFKLRTLKEYIEENKANLTPIFWKVLSFQLLYALYKLQKRYVLFRHNNLNLDSVYVYVTKQTATPKVIKIQDKIFNVPDMGFEIKLTNFYDSYIPEFAENKNTTLTKENAYYDVHHIFSSLYHLKIADTNLSKFIDEIIPEKFRSSNEKTIGLDEDYYQQNVINILNPLMIIIKNNFFTDLIKEDINQMTSPMDNNIENLNEFRMEENSIDYMLSTSASDYGMGERPSMLGKQRSISGRRVLPVMSKSLIKKGGRKTFNDFGELTETNDDHKEPESESSDEDNEMPKNQKETTDDEDNEEEDEDNEEEDEDEDEDEDDDEIDKLDGETITSEVVESGAGIMNMFKQQKPQQPKQQNNGLFNAIEYMAKANKPQQPMEFAMPKHNKKNKGKKGKKGKYTKGFEHPLLNKLPSNYSGMAPDWMQSLLPTPNNGMQGQGMQGMDYGMQNMQNTQGMDYGMQGQGMPIGNMPPQMNMNQGMQHMPPQIDMNQGMQHMPPQMPMPPQMQQGMPPNMPQGMPIGNMPPAGQSYEQFSSQQQANKTSMFDGLASIGSKMGNVSMGTQDHASYLPAHLLMNNQQANMYQNQGQMGGKKGKKVKKNKLEEDDEFFFLMGGVKK